MEPTPFLTTDEKEALKKELLKKNKEFIDNFAYRSQSVGHLTISIERDMTEASFEVLMKLYKKNGGI